MMEPQLLFELLFLSFMMLFGKVHIMFDGKGDAATNFRFITQMSINEADIAISKLIRN